MRIPSAIALLIVVILLLPIAIVTRLIQGPAFSFAGAQSATSPTSQSEASAPPTTQASAPVVQDSIPSIKPTASTASKPQAKPIDGDVFIVHFANNLLAAANLGVTNNEIARKKAASDVEVTLASLPGKRISLTFNVKSVTETSIALQAAPIRSEARDYFQCHFFFNPGDTIDASQQEYTYPITPSLDQTQVERLRPGCVVNIEGTIAKFALDPNAPLRASSISQDLHRQHYNVVLTSAAIGFYNLPPLPRSSLLKDK